MEYITVKELFKITKGKKVEEIDYENENSIRYIQIDDLRNNNNIKHCENINKYVIAKKEDIIIAWDGANAGTIGFGIEGAIGSTLAILRKENKEMDTEFCGLFLRSKSAYLREKCTGATIPHIQRTALEDIKIPKISLNKQIEIKNIINKAQELIDKRKEQIEALDELVKSQFIEMFGDIKNNPIGWEKIKIGDVFEIKTGATPSRKENKYWDNGTIPWIKTTELKEIVINNSEEYITEEGFNKSSVNLLPKNTLLIAMYGQGKTRGMTGKLGIEATTNQACAAILPNPKENMDFIWYQLKLSYEDLRDLGRGGSQPNLNTNLIKSYQLIFPPMELQNKFVQFTKQVDKLKFK